MKDSLDKRDINQINKEVNASYKLIGENIDSLNEAQAKDLLVLLCKYAQENRLAFTDIASADRYRNELHELTKNW